MNEIHALPLQSAIRPLTEEEKVQQRTALAASRALLERMKARRGMPYDESWPLIRREKAEREQRQA